MNCLLTKIYNSLDLSKIELTRISNNGRGIGGHL